MDADNSQPTFEDRIRQIKRRYESQAKFADPDPAYHYREFVRLLDEALSQSTLAERERKP